MKHCCVRGRGDSLSLSHTRAYITLAAISNQERGIYRPATCEYNPFFASQVIYSLIDSRVCILTEKLKLARAHIRIGILRKMPKNSSLCTQTQLNIQMEPEKAYK